MAKTRGTGLLMRWADVDAQYEVVYKRINPALGPSS